ncbi:MAG: PhzF family phenazine biosynthesis protein [Bacteroidales bacterium]|nr:PhzF family phenazine biosynthesis protein [Bacteroidales bacterium]MBO7530122.1 PhzF family phenazine biosynthesis protein [Bacteroidales bacterium]
MNYFIVDAFTDKPFGGNPAGVVAEGSFFYIFAEDFQPQS